MTNRLVKITLRGDIADLQAKMAVASKSVQDAGLKMTGASKEAKVFRAGLSTLGATAGKVGLVAGAGLAIAVKSAADFNAEMALVRTLSHAGAADMDKLSRAALTVGQNIGYSAKSVAQGEEELVKAGVSVKDILGGALKGSLDLAAAGQTDVATATSIAAQALTQFQLSGKDIPHLADLLAAGADKALGSVEDLGQGLTQAGTTANQMGLSVEQTVGTLTAFAQAGLIGERGGTTFKQMLLQLAAPSGQAQKIMDKLGISLYNTSGQIKTMPELADNLQKSLQGLDPASRNAALGIIFGSRAIQGANILMADGSKGIQEWIDKTNDQGFAAQQAAGKLDSLAGDAKKLGTALQTAFIGTGSGSQGPLRTLTQDATAAVSAFNKMPGPVHDATGALLGIVAVTGGALWFGSKVINGIASTRTALENLGPAGARASGALGGIAGRAAGIIAVATAVNILGRALDGSVGNNVNSGHLNRELDALTHGHDTGSLDAVANSLHGLEERGAGVANALFKIPGAIVGIRTSFQHNTDVVSAFDEQLAQLVEAGKADEAEQVFGRIAAAASAQGVSVEETASHFKQYQLALQNAQDAALSSSGAARLMSDAMTGLINPTGKLGKVVAQSADDLKAQAKALAASRKAARDTAHQFVGLGQSVNNSKVSLNGWITDLQKQAAALRDFTKNAQTAGKKGLREGLIKELEAAGPEGALRMKQLADASEKEIHRANRAWASQQRAIRAYVDAVGGVPKAVATDVNVNGVPSAISAVQALKSLMDSLHDRNIHITVNKSTNATVAEAASNHANGGTIPHAASGWTVAGQRHPYGDKVLAYLAPGEEVITNRHGEADKFRADRAAGRIPAYSAGSAISVPAGSGNAFDYDRLAGAVTGNRLLAHRDTRDALLWAMRKALSETPILRSSSPDLSMLAGAS